MNALQKKNFNQLRNRKSLLKSYYTVKTSFLSTRSFLAGYKRWDMIFWVHNYRESVRDIHGSISVITCFIQGLRLLLTTCTSSRENQQNRL